MENNIKVIILIALFINALGFLFFFLSLEVKKRASVVPVSEELAFEQELEEDKEENENGEEVEVEAEPLTEYQEIVEILPSSEEQDDPLDLPYSEEEEEEEEVFEETTKEEFP